MKSPLVSVIVNCHNGQKYLSNCIQSILNQTYKNFEIIFYDNLSKDNSFQIISKYKDKRIKSFKTKKYFKLYKSRNFAIKKAKGKYITFCDTDDLWIKDKLKNQINLILKNKNIKIMYSNFYVLDEEKEKKYLQYKRKLPSGFITQDLLNYYCIGILTTMIDRRIFNKYLFNSTYDIIGDFDFFIKLSMRFKFYPIQKPLAIYRIHENNFSIKKSDIYILELKKWIINTSKLLQSKNYSIKTIKNNLIKLKIKTFFKKYFLIKLGV